MANSFLQKFTSIYETGMTWPFDSIRQKKHSNI